MVYNLFIAFFSILYGKMLKEKWKISFVKEKNAISREGGEVSAKRFYLCSFVFNFNWKDANIFVVIVGIMEILCEPKRNVSFNSIVFVNKNEIAKINVGFGCQKRKKKIIFST